MSTLAWSDKLSNQLEPMDQTHREFIEMYNTMAAALAQGSAEQLLAAMDAFIDHTEAHFAMENRWMAAVGFPGCHKGEHDRVMQVLLDVRRRTLDGDTFLCRRLIEELPAWFEGHVNGMDAALAYYLGSIGFDVNAEVAGEAGCGTAACSCSTAENVALAAH